MFVPHLNTTNYSGNSQTQNALRLITNSAITNFMQITATSINNTEQLTNDFNCLIISDNNFLQFFLVYSYARSSVEQILNDPVVYL